MLTSDGRSVKKSDQHYGPQIVAEAHALYAVLEAGTSCYGAKYLEVLVKNHIPILQLTPAFQAKLAAGLKRDTGWGRCVFINMVFELIDEHFGIKIPDVQSTHKKKSARR